MNYELLLIRGKGTAGGGAGRAGYPPNAKRRCSGSEQRRGYYYFSPSL